MNTNRNSRLWVLSLLNVLQVLLVIALGSSESTEAKVAVDDSGVSNSIGMGGGDSSVINVIKDEVVNFRFSASNPTGEPLGISAFTLFVNEIASGSGNFVKLAEGDFVLKWTAKLPDGYPAPGKLLQKIEVRYSVEGKVVSVPLGQVDVAEWEGLVAVKFYADPDNPYDSPLNSLYTLCHHDGKIVDSVNLEYLASKKSPGTCHYRGPKKMPVFTRGDVAVKGYATIPNEMNYPLFRIDQTTGSPYGWSVMGDLSDSDKYSQFGALLVNHTGTAIDYAVDSMGSWTAGANEVTFMGYPDGTEPQGIAVSMKRSGRDFYSSYWPFWGADGTRFIQFTDVSPADNNRLRVDMATFYPEVWVKTTAYAAGTADIPGVPLSSKEFKRYSPNAYSDEGGLLCMAGGNTHKVNIKLGTEAKAVFPKVRLSLKTQAGGAPQPGMKVWMKTDSGETALAFVDGEIEFEKNTDLFEKMISASGQDFRLMVDGVCDTMHVLRLEVPYEQFRPTLEADSHIISTTRLLPVDLVPDYNRDGKIDQSDRGKVTEDKPWRFWVNDNDDSETIDGSDIPGSGNNGNDSQVNGIRDLVDWFPLFLDIKEILKVLPSADYDYVLENADNALNMVETTLIPANAGEFLKAELGEPGQRNNPNGVALAHIAGYFKHVDAQDAKLSADFLSRVEDGTGGVLIMEASKATTQPLKLVIRKKSGGVLVAEVSFPLSVQSVEKMYRHLNILSTNGQSGGLATNLNEPKNQPDAESSSKNFVFVHGYNVNPSQARGWNAAVFKRLWHSGSRAKFTGVTWYGSETQGMIPGQPSVTPNYQANVLNAFASASALKDGLEPLEGGIHIAAHSLGNMVVSSAMHDFGFAADKYFLIDAAVAKESYDETEEQRLIMSNPWWEDYDDQLRATDWHLLPWPQNDWRAKLTWVNRLKDIGNAYNFYSSGEEVLKNPEHGNIPLISGFSGELTWASQEKRKGFGLTGQILTSTYGGWETNKHVDYGTRVTHSTTGALVGFIPKTQAQLGPVDAAFKQKLMQIPFFNTGFDPVTGQTLGTAPADIANLLGPNGSDYASPPQKRNTLLAEMIPAQSTAAGSNPINSFGVQNFDMNGMKMGWPATRDDKNWRHSDLRAVSYTYTFPVFDEISQIGNLKE